MKVLVTGGAGYIGSHATLALLKAGHEVVSLDNYCNSSPESLRRVARLAGREARAVEGDLRDRTAVNRLFREDRFDAVMHFAGLKAVNESVKKPQLYQENNVGGTRVLLEAMEGAGCRQLVFSSSCTVYGEVRSSPVSESHPRAAFNPYGQTKLDIELLCEALAKDDPSWRVALLRYFNPVGAHESGDIGEDPRGEPNNLMPYVMQVAVGRRERVSVWGGDYATHDGTCLRDFIHVMDLVDGHLKALDAIKSFKGAEPVNLGTGRAHSVLELIAAASKAAGKRIPWIMGPRREGDAPAIWADASLAKKKLGWTAARDLDAMCRDHFRWQSKNPEGYGA
ncbi:MAG: UDP-glucose 4-epimerase GalE [Elusimicrobiota bacterium]|nr:UDP-glucose 4-epimerase GalE [Elusimicrobiota bacterium]